MKNLISCGGNDLGQCGRKISSGCVRPSIVDLPSNSLSLELESVVSGSSHNLACTKDGKVFSWGSNTDYQTGLLDSDANENGVFDRPTIVQFPEAVKVRCVSAGAKHSVALASSGKLFMWGSNSFGQLGLGKEVEISRHPQVVKGIEGLPIANIACGSFHTFITTVSGRVFACGLNKFGQLGLGDTKDQFVFARNNNLKPFFVLKIACGEQHSLFLCSKVEPSSSSTLQPNITVMSCGNGFKGQLGFHSEDLVLDPVEILWSDNLNVRDISCGRKHSLCLTEEGRVFAFGLNNLGQLGLDHSNDVFKPTLVTNIPGPVGLIAAGGDQSFCVLRANISTFERRFPIDRIDAKFVEDFTKCPTEFVNTFGNENFRDMVSFVFSDAASVNSSFLHSYPSRRCQSTPQESSVDLDTVSLFFSTLSEMYNSAIDRALTSAIDSLFRSLPREPADIECLRLYLSLSQCYILDCTNNWQTLIVPFAAQILHLNTSALKILKYWFRNADTRFLAKLLSVYKEVINHFVNFSIKSGTNVFQDEQGVKSLMISLRMMELLYSINDMKTNSKKLPPNRFYVKQLTTRLDLENDYIVWLHKRTSGQNSKNASSLSQICDPFRVVPVCDFPFVFDVPAKSALLACEALIKMQRVVTQVQLQSLMASNFVGMACPFLVLCVNRYRIKNNAIV